MRIACINSSINFRTIGLADIFFHYTMQGGVADGVERIGSCDYFDNSMTIPKFRRCMERYDGVLGVIGLGVADGGAAWAKLQHEIPCVSMTVEPPGGAVNYVGTDERAGMRELIDHVHAEGYRRIGYFGFRNESYSRERFAEYTASMRRLKLTINEAWLYGPAADVFLGRRGAKLHFGEIDPPVRQAALDAFIARGDLPDVIVFETDILAHEFYVRAAAAGVRIPGDVAIAGFDGNRILFPPHGYSFLTTSVQDFEAIGRTAVSMLSSVIRGRRTGGRILIPPRLRIRASTRTAPLDADSRFRSDAVAYIEAKYADKDVSKRMAADFAMSHRYFLVKFKRIIGEDFTDFVNACRIDKAAFFVRNSDRPISEILWDAGFRNYQNFITFFKRRFGMPPTAYRRRR